MFSFRLLLIFISLFSLAACGLWATRPKEEMSMAAGAFIAAKEAKADVLAPTQYRKAEFYYLKAKSSYRRKYFNKAKQYALLAQRFAEEAEYIAKRKEAVGDTPVTPSAQIPIAKPIESPTPAPSAEKLPPAEEEKE